MRRIYSTTVGSPNFKLGGSPNFHSPPNWKFLGVLPTALQKVDLRHAHDVTSAKSLNNPSCRVGWSERSCPRSATAIPSVAVDRTPNLPIGRRTLYHWANRPSPSSSSHDSAIQASTHLLLQSVLWPKHDVGVFILRPCCAAWFFSFIFRVLRLEGDRIQKRFKIPFRLMKTSNRLI